MHTAISIASAIGGWFADPIKRHAKYLFCLSSIIKDHAKENEQLASMRQRLGRDVDQAIRNAEEIEEDVRNWLSNVGSITIEVEGVTDKGCFYRLCPKLIGRYRRGKNLAQKTTTIIGLKRHGNVLLHRVSRPVPPPGIELLSSGDFRVFKTTKSALNEIVEALNDNQSNVIGVYGMGGVGKTTLVIEVGKKAKDLKLFDHVVMAVVSQHPNVTKIQGQIADMLGLKFDQESELGRANQLRARLKNENKILIILDDVWATLSLEAIGIPLGCKIVLTTRVEPVCTSMGCRRKIALNVLSQLEAWDLFSSTSGVDGDSLALTEAAREVARECKGLPLAIVTLGVALRGKSLEEWKVALEQLKMSRLEDIEATDKNVYACLKLSYDNLRGQGTKSCFLLCSLFPEDYAIDVEDLVRYGIGLGWFQYVDSIDQARSLVHVIVNNLKASCLLLDANEEGFVKMHDLVRDVAIWIASEGNSKNVFMVRAGLGLKDWPRMDNLEHCTAISVMSNELTRLPDQMECPELQILLLGENGLFNNLSYEFFEGMRTVKVLDLSALPANCVKYYSKNSDTTFSLPHSLQPLSNLRTLNLRGHKLDTMSISILGMLKRLEILDLSGSEIEELPNEVGEMKNLRMLDVSGCSSLKRIPSHVISGLSLLEELYIGGNSFKEWAIEGEGTSGERNNASLSELNSLRNLAILSLFFESAKCLPGDFYFPYLSKYTISNYHFSGLSSYPTSRTLIIDEINAPSLFAFKELLPNVEYLTLMNIGESCPNVIPDVDQGGLNQLITLRLQICLKMEYLIDATQRAPPTAFSNLVELNLEYMKSMREICRGLPPMGFLQKLRTLKVKECSELCNIARANLELGLQKLEDVRVEGCDKLQEVFQLDGHDHVEEKNALLLSRLRELDLLSLPQLECIWKGPTQGVALKSLTRLELKSCPRLRYLFTPSLARSLVQLECLTICQCEDLEHIITEEEDDVRMLSRGHSQPVHFPKLRAVRVENCDRLISLFPGAGPTARGVLQLRELCIVDAYRLKDVFGSEGIRDLQYHNNIVLQELRILELRRLASFNGLSSGNYHIRCRSLQRLEVEEYSLSVMTGITAILEATLRSPPENLQFLSVTNCSKISALLPPNLVESNLENPRFSNLRELPSTILPKPSCAGEGPSKLIGFEHLQYLEVYNCRSLRFMFSPTLAPSLVELENLKIHHCEGLEQIIMEDDEDEILSSSHPQTLFFPKLRSLEIKGCQSLKSILPIKIARGLLQLQVLSIDGASHLEEAFGHKEEGAEKEILLPKLWSLELLWLPRLINFCPASYHFTWPSLQSLRAADCRRLTTRFSAASDGTVHATTEVTHASYNNNNNNSGGGGDDNDGASTF